MLFLTKVTEWPGGRKRGMSQERWEEEHTRRGAVCSTIRLREWLEDTLYSWVWFSVWLLIQSHLWHSDPLRGRCSLLFLWFKPGVAASLSWEMMIDTPMGSRLAQYDIIAYIRKAATLQDHWWMMVPKMVFWAKWYPNAFFSSENVFRCCLFCTATHDD